MCLRFQENRFSLGFPYFKQAIKMFLLFTVTILYLSDSVCGNECPPQYKRFSMEHSFCLNPDASCDFLQQGVTERQRNTILETLNTLRSQVATGQYRDTSGRRERTRKTNEVNNATIGKAMMQVVWDEELASSAQNWAAQCRFENDCLDCRDVENFSVGQFVAYLEEKECLYKDILTPRWEDILTPRTSKDEKNSLLDFMTTEFSKLYNDFFSWMTIPAVRRVGCGFASFITEVGAYRQLYVCNFAPRYLHRPLEGQPCLECPTNSCCGVSCPHANHAHPGLCSMLEPNAVPAYKKEPKVFYECTWTEEDENCPGEANFTFSAQPNWRIRDSLDGWNLYWSVARCPRTYLRHKESLNDSLLN